MPRSSRVTATFYNSFLGLSDTQARDKHSELERVWRQASGTLEWEGDMRQADFQALVFRSIFESGDILAVRRQRLDPGDIVATKVQLIEADRISNPRGAMDTELLSGGVEVDGSGRTVAYHVSNVHPGEVRLEEPTNWARVPKHGSSGLTLSRLIFQKQRPGQRRGIPALSPVMEPIKQITRLTDYELMSSVVSAMFTIFIESENQAAGQLPVAPVGEVAPTKAGDVFMPGGGAVIDLRPGEKVQTADPTRPNEAFEPFFEALVTQIGMSIEIPFEVLMHRYQNSFSAAKAAMLDAYRFFVTRRQFLADHFLSMCYEWVVNDAVLNGLIDLPGFVADPMMRKAWLGAEWIGPSHNQIDPQKEVTAAIARIDAGLSDRKYETAQISGRDWDRDVQPQRLREKQRLEEDAMGFSAVPMAPSSGGEEGEEEGGAEGGESTKKGEKAA